MRAGVVRLLLVALAVAGVLAPAPAGAVTHGLDRAFGSDGMVAFEQPVTGVAVSGARTYVAYGGTVAALTRTGALDPTFGSGGRVVVDPGFFGHIPTGATLSVDDQGRVLASLPYLDGRDASRGGTGLDLVRLLPDGSFDLSWGDSGRVMNRRVGLQAAGRTLPDGRVLLHERSTPDRDYPDGRRDTLVRYSADGSYDPSFGVLDLHGPGYYYALDGVQLLPDGGVVVNRPGQGLSQFTSQGTPDTSFGDGGTTAVPESFGLSRTAAGRLLTASEGYDETPPTLMAYTADGQVDTAFGDGGAAELRSGCGLQRVRQVLEDAGGALTVVVDQAGSGCQTVLQRVTADGSTVGRVADGVDPARPMTVAVAAVGPTGAVLLAGRSGTGPDPGRVAALVLAGPGTLPVYRYWSPRFGNANFFTTSEAERRVLAQDRNWEYEQVGFRAYPVSGTACFPGRVPVYRFWSERFQSHFFTASDTERQGVLRDPNWSYEGAGFCVDPGSSAESRPVYRFWSPTFGKHHYTADPAEAQNLTTNDRNWQAEGVGFFVP